MVYTEREACLPRLRRPLELGHLRQSAPSWRLGPHLLEVRRQINVLLLNATGQKDERHVIIHRTATELWTVASKRQSIPSVKCSLVANRSESLSLLTASIITFARLAVGPNFSGIPKTT